MAEMEIEQLLARLAAAAARIQALQTAVEQGAPWPAGALAAGEGEGHWGPTEVLAHAAEMLPYWLGEMERILAAPADETTTFGRNPDDPVRRLTVIRDSSLPARELVARIADGVRRYHDRLPGLSTADLARRGRHRVRGEVSALDLLHRFVVDHLEDHVRQLTSELQRESAAARPATDDRA